MGRVRTEDQSILCRGAYSRRTEVWKVLGDPRRCRETRRSATDAATGNIRSGSLLDHTNLMPLMNTAFAPGHCREAVEAMTAGLSGILPWQSITISAVGRRKRQKK